MEEKRERYLVSTTDGRTHCVVDTTFTEIVQKIGEENIWQIIKLDYEEAET